MRAGKPAGLTLPSEAGIIDEVSHIAKVIFLPFLFVLAACGALETDPLPTYENVALRAAHDEESGDLVIKVVDSETVEVDMSGDLADEYLSDPLGVFFQGVEFEGDEIVFVAPGTYADRAHVIAGYYFQSSTVDPVEDSGLTNNRFNQIVLSTSSEPESDASQQSGFGDGLTLNLSVGRTE